jgi:hypothetical protein
MTPTVIISPASPEGDHHWGWQYVERWWTPVLGPSACLLGRMIADQLTGGAGEPIIFDVEDARWRLGNSSLERFGRAWARLADFGPLRTDSTGFSFPVYIGQVPERHMRRWTPEQVAAHDKELAAFAVEPW